ncbi:hypothetical protein MNBD_GAMMA04-1071 [hydrothermal vent metagenome]|uniref:Ketopantoate reductase N-terminal domain-containing protein n=1 Tax=hydrothermal vent metagenome TaxID=652676 RepID=A0A3B0VV95_9ZZZZ
MKDPIIVIGLGELGSVFARGFLKLGYPVQAINRTMSMQTVAQDIPTPTAILVSVGEADLAQTLADLPSEWKNNVILLQNELLPRDWLAANIEDPTVISVWFEKKKGMDSKVVIPSPIYGTHAKLICYALSTLDLPSFILDSEEALVYELVRKNLYILTTNIAGLEVGGNVEQLAQQHPNLMQAVANDVLDIQDWLTQTKNDRTHLMEGLIEAFNGDPEHGCMGRSAPARLARAIQIADQAKLSVPKLRKIAEAHL